MVATPGLQGHCPANMPSWRIVLLAAGLFVGEFCIRGNTEELHQRQIVDLGQVTPLGLREL